MSKAMSTFQQKVDWMVKHQPLWSGWPQANYSDEYLIQQMRNDGLISGKSHDGGIMDFGKLVAAAREQIHKQESE
jgi:glycerol-3-phosphate responsive antiterminator